MFWEFLKKKLGLEIYEKVNTMIEGFEIFGESEVCQILSVIGKDNKDCIQIIWYLKTIQTP